MITTPNRLKFARRALKDASDSLARHDFTKAALAIEFARGMLDGIEDAGKPVREPGYLEGIWP